MKHDVLIADDDEHLREVLDLMFKDKFNLSFSETGQETLDKIQSHAFHFIILDIHLPGKSGIDICREIKNMPPEKRPHVVILSADSNDTIVREAYELGVGDYICKPFNVTAFQERMMRFSRDIEIIEELQNRDKEPVIDDDFKQMAETAMMQAASYGSGLEIISRLNNCHSIESLANELMNSLLHQEFHTAVQLRTHDTVHSFDVDVQECSDIEMQIFDLLKSHGRIYHFGKRSIFNDEHISILVKNMPKVGTRSYDALLDLAAKLVPAVNARFMSLCEHMSLLETKESLNKALALLAEGIGQMEKDKKELMEAIESNISLSFHKLNMDEEQEQFFIDMIEKEIRQREDNTQMDELQSLIKNCADSLEIMEKDEPEETNSEVSSADVELF